MNCWEILGIEPTGDRRKIQDAYEQQLKFASEDEARSLEQAFREAVGDNPAPVTRETGPAQPEQRTHEQLAEPERPLDANEGQIAREVVIQIKALLNDASRSKDAGIWKAILCEPPADQPLLRQEIGRQLEPQLRPMAENGSFPPPVAQFLGEWFGWFSVEQAPDMADERNYPEPGMSEEQGEQPPQMANFWPAVIGWIIGLVILATLFGGMGGG
ncbi:J domain-containing protein [Marinobacter sp.]|uniref:J domain-containing protein n=1 Tax=Marinobacter sp. TaxID=50741 RepID=UPI003567518F